jgi:uncharacterized protein
VIRRSKFDAYITRELRESFLEPACLCDLVIIRERIQPCADPTDDKFIEAAVSGDAGTLVGDRALLAMRPFRDVRLMTPTTYVTLAENPVSQVRTRKMHDERFGRLSPHSSPNSIASMSSSE